MNKQISSVQNAMVKRLLQLQEKSRNRKKEGAFIVEGLREIKLALKGGFLITEIYFCPDLFSSQEISRLFLHTQSPPEVIEISAEVYNKIAYRGSTEGIIGIGKAKNLDLNDLQLEKENLLLLVAEAPEKPGNIGALLRTADAAGVDAVIIANPRTDLYNPNIIRSSVGCVFTKEIAYGSTTEIIAFLRQKKITIFAATLQASTNYCEVDYSSSCAIVVGTEATGLGKEWLENATQHIIIPMQGEIDSMNVSVAAGILVFEAKRQRGFQRT